MKKSNLMPSVVLGTICIVVALILSVINLVTGPIIEKAQNDAVNKALVEVLPDAKNFEKIELTSEYPESVKEGYKAEGGFVFKMSVTGKSAGLIIMCGVDESLKIVGTKVIANEETPSYASKVFPDVEGLDGKYKGMNLDEFEPYLVSGATLTSRAYSDAVKAALQSAIIAGGGEVDTRTPEEILQANCNTALGTENKVFTKWFATEIIEGVDAIYENADAGRVYVFGEEFIGIKTDGTVATADASAENITKAQSADTTIKNSTATDVQIPEGSESTIVSIRKTASGNYIIEAYGKGYGVNGGSKYHPASGKPIVVKVCISSEGAIIDSVTTFEEETPDFGGSLLANPEFYEAYEGKTSEDYSSVENYSGATYTGNGYKDALKNAFAVFELIAEGGND